MDRPLKLELGTVMFAAGTGRHALSVSPDEVRCILEEAWQAGISLLNIDPRAGNSLEVLAKGLPSHHAFQPILTLSSEGVSENSGSFPGNPPPGNPPTDNLEEDMERALSLVNQTCAYAVMTSFLEERPTLAGQKQLQRLEQLKHAGWAEKIGVSVSNARQLDCVFDVGAVDIVQVPLNVLDTRLLESGRLARLKQSGVEIHVRDVFLQGVLLDPTRLHPWFWPIRDHLETYHQYLIQEGLTPLEGALGFVVSLPEVDYALVGATDAIQLGELIAAAGLATTLQPADFAPFACRDARFIDPTRWNLYE